MSHLGAGMVKKGDRINARSARGEGREESYWGIIVSFVHTLFVSCSATEN